MEIEILINGASHVPVNHGNRCEDCSLKKFCPKIIGPACCDNIDHFEYKK